MAIWKVWEPTTGVQPKEGDCGTCVHIRRDGTRMMNRSVFACALRTVEEVYPYRVKATKPPPPWCPRDFRSTERSIHRWLNR